MGLTTITDPLKSDGHVITVWAREEGLGVNNPFIDVILRQGATEIARLQIPQNTLTTTFTEYNYTLTATEADSISDYSILEYELFTECIGCPAGGSRDQVSISYAVFSVLDALPVPPATLDTVSVINSTSLQINFTEPVDTSQVLSYNIERESGLGFNVVGNVPQGTTTFDDSGLIADTFYTYRIVSVGASENSIPSNQVSQRTTVILSSARPDSNPSVRWVNGIGVPPCEDTSTFECVNEAVRDDGDFIQSTGIGSSNTDTDIMTLSDIDDPLRSDSHFLKYTLREAGVGTNPVGFTITLKQGVTTIASFTHAQGSITEGAFIVYQQELSGAQSDSITDYSDLSVELEATCVTGCGNTPSEREKLNVSFVVFEIEQVSAPSIARIDTLTSTSLRLLWTSDDLDAEITDIIIQRENGTDFLNIGNVTIATFTFDDIGLAEQTVFKYRLKGMIPSGFSKEGTIFEGATPPSETTLNTQGAIIEPSVNNAFSVLERQEFAQSVEFYNLNKTTIRLIVDDMEINQLNAYESILKMINGTYDSSQGLKNAGAFYGTDYLEFSDVTQFLANIKDTIRNATGHTTEGDDNRIPNGTGT